MRALTLRTGYIEVGRVQVFARGHPLGLAVLDAVHATGPVLVPPWEEDEAEFSHDIRVGNVEVVLHCADGYHSSQLTV